MNCTQGKRKKKGNQQTQWVSWDTNNGRKENTEIWLVRLYSKTRPSTTTTVNTPMPSRWPLSEWFVLCCFKRGIQQHPCLRRVDWDSTKDHSWVVSIAERRMYVPSSCWERWCETNDNFRKTKWKFAFDVVYVIRGFEKCDEEVSSCRSRRGWTATAKQQQTARERVIVFPCSVSSRAHRC